jgi:hypothetical protein
VGVGVGAGGAVGLDEQAAAIASTTPTIAAREAPLKFIAED